MTTVLPTDDVILYARSTEHARDEARQYGYVDAAFERFTVVTPYDLDISVALALPPETKWCLLVPFSETTRRNYDMLFTTYGPPSTIPAAMNVQNENTVGAYRGRWQNGDGTPG